MEAWCKMARAEDDPVWDRRYAPLMLSVMRP